MPSNGCGRCTNRACRDDGEEKWSIGWATWGEHFAEVVPEETLLGQGRGRERMMSMRQIHVGVWATVPRDLKGSTLRLENFSV